MSASKVYEGPKERSTVMGDYKLTHLTQYEHMPSGVKV